jgi:hypothetical protein
MPFAFQLELADRAEDRVQVAVSMVPSGAPQNIEGVAVQLLSRAGDPLSPRLLLPVSGRLSGALMTTAELRAKSDLPLGARVHGTAWGDGFSLEASCPADRWTELAAHVRGRPAAGIVTRHVDLEPLIGEEKDELIRRLGWLAECPWCETNEPLEATSEEDERELCNAVDELGLDEEDAEWLKDLLHE